MMMLLLEVKYKYSTIQFIRIVEISSLANACIGQPLLTFWSHPEPSWMFAVTVAAFKDNQYCFAALLPLINLKGAVV